MHHREGRRPFLLHPLFSGDLQKDPAERNVQSQSVGKAENVLGHHWSQGKTVPRKRVHSWS